jgi:hypothetical protein
MGVSSLWSLWRGRGFTCFVSSKLKMLRELVTIEFLVPPSILNNKRMVDIGDKKRSNYCCIYSWGGQFSYQISNF